MPEFAALVSFILTCFAIELTPGPNMSYLALLSAMQGRRAGFAAVLGVGVGLLCIGMLSALGAATLMAGSPTIYQTLRWAGVAYLLWLALDCWRGIGTPAAAASAAQGRLVWRGFVINMLNPKAALFYITVLPSFAAPSAPLLPQTLALTAISVSVATLVHCAIVLLAARAQPYAQNVRIATRVRYFFTAMLVGVALWFALSTHAMPQL